MRESWGRTRVGKSGGVGVGGGHDTVGELAVGKDERKQLTTIELAPVTLGMLDEFVDHRQAGLTAAGALCPAVA